MNLSVEIAAGKRSLTLANPIMVASGTFSYGLEYAKIFDIQRLGAVVTKTTTLKPRAGSPTPRIDETPGGMLNSIGLQNIGVAKLRRDLAPVWARWKVPVVVSILGGTVDEYGECAAALDGTEGVSALELNISSPNAQQGGMEFGQDPVTAARVTAACVRATQLPVIVKLTPNVTSIVEVARAVAEAGAHALVVINTLQAMTIDSRTTRPRIARTFAGLSGPAIKPVALRMVWQVAGAVDVPVIGCGGITTPDDAIEFLMAGASAVQVGTATFRDPLAPIRVLDGIEAHMTARGVSDISDLVGAARPA
jgi:dihydroorotate dehydrogenase (NAD+) catalytic subunit